MTRQRKVDPEVLEREYIYDQGSPPVSFTELAKRHGVARNTVAERGVAGRWYERRKEFREQLGMKVVEELGEEWVRMEAAIRSRLMSTGLAYLARYEKALAEDKIVVNTKDALGIGAMLVALTKDAAATTNGKEVELIDPDTVHLDPDSARRTLAVIEDIEARRQLESGLGDEPDDADDAEAERAPVAGLN